jgi:murein L,D-transpeptidase YcbB/YkuD
VLAALFLVTVGAAGCQTESAPPLSKVLQTHVQTDSGRHAQAIRQAYKDSEWQPIWLTQSEPTGQARALLRQLCEAPNEGLSREQYDTQALIDRLESLYLAPDRDAPVADSAGYAALAAADVELTRTFLQYADHLTTGRVQPSEVQGSWNVDQDRAASGEILREARAQGVRKTLDETSARHVDYRPLRDALKRYRLIANAGGWPTLPTDVTLSHGDIGPNVVALQKRLAMTDNLKATRARSGDVQTAVYDISVVRAVEQFQTRHGLEVTGAVSADTRRALNVSAHERVRQLALNLERHRWLPENLGQDFVFVNIMDFELTAYRDGAKAMEMPVVVGEEDKQTTAFADTMRYVVFGPYWNIPREIAIDEILPKVQADSTYLAQNNYEVVNAAGEVVDVSLLSEEALNRYEVRLREKPGAGNSLGLVKFMFPNDHDIYLHDTPADHLFYRPQRTFSHGCVRVEDPIAFASHVLPQGWTKERVREAMHSGERKRVSLRQRLPVYLVYLTAWAEPGGLVHFRRDLYDHDDALEAALDEPDPRPNTCIELNDRFQAMSEDESTGLFAAYRG